MLGFEHVDVGGVLNAERWPMDSARGSVPQRLVVVVDS